MHTQTHTLIYIYIYITRKCNINITTELIKNNINYFTSL